MKLSARKQLIKKCDDLAGKMTRARSKCERCGATQHLQSAHVISRTYMATRFDPENLMALCAGCHLWWHKEPFLAVQWFNQKWPGRFDKLNFKRQAITKVDLQIVYLMLQSDARKGPI